jgi:hypothetical protein
VPFWTYFPVQESADDLRAYLDRTTYDEIDVMLFSHGVESRGLATAEAWQGLAGRALRRGRLLGVDASAFPADFPAFVRYSRELRSLPDVDVVGPPLLVGDALAGLAADPRVVVGQ